jgi:hypothetical protein
MIAAAYAARFWLRANLPTMSNWMIGLVSDVPAASSDCLKPGAAAMSALFIEAPKPPSGGRSVPTPLSQDAVPVAQLTRAGEPRYKFTVR